MAERMRGLLKGSLGPPDNDSRYLLDVHSRELPGEDTMRRYDPADEVDLVIVGAGAGGSVLAQRLARRGWRIVILEAGPFWHPDEDWVSDEAGSHDLYWTQKRIIGGADPIELGKNNSGRGVGGSMIHYAGYCPRFHPSDLRTRSADGVGADWPLDYEDLRPHYELVERELPVAGQNWPWGYPHRYPFSPHPVSGAASVIWRDDTPPGRQWLKLSKKTFSADSRRPWTSLDEEVSWSPVICLPGRKNLGLGRHWHFMTIQFWILTGAVYVALVFATGYWRYLIPTSWSLFPDSIRAVGTYLQFHIPDKIPGQPFEPAQKLAYFVVIFVLAPLQIASGAAMSPSVIGRFPWYARLFGGKQGARSWHFIGLCLFAAFIVVHVVMVLIHGLPDEFVKVVLAGHGSWQLALAVGLTGLFLIGIFHVVITWFSLRYRRATQRLLGFIVNPFERALSRSFASRQRFKRHQISPYHLVNGYPPAGPEYEQMARDEFRDYRLDVGGLVERPVSLSLAELRALGYQRQVTKHNCIQGWTSVAEWGGVPLTRLIEAVGPLPQARHLVFYAMDDKGLTEGEGRYGFFYGSIPLHLARKPQALLALDMNGGPLPAEYGAPVRLRIETQLGFKMVKWIKAVEFTDDISGIGMGQGGWREDQQYYANAAGI